MNAAEPDGEVAPGIHRIVTRLGERVSCLFLLVGPEAAVLFDTGVDGAIGEHVLPRLASLGIPASSVRTVVISHADVDHFGGVAETREAFPDALILAGVDDIPLIEDFDTYLERRADGFAADYGWHEDAAVIDWCRSVTRSGAVDAPALDGEPLDLGGGRVAVLQAVPGHSRGHLAIDAPWADAVLVSDAVLGRSVDLADGTPAFPPTYRHVDDYLATIERLQRLDRALLLTAHYPVLRGDAARAFLAESRDFALALDALVLADLREHPHGATLAELLQRLNPVAGHWPTEGTAGALAFPVAGHLERLAASGEVVCSGQRAGVPVWSVPAGASA